MMITLLLAFILIVTGSTMLREILVSWDPWAVYRSYVIPAPQPQNLDSWVEEEPIFSPEKVANFIGFEPTTQQLTFEFPEIEPASNDQPQIEWKPTVTEVSDDDSPSPSPSTTTPSDNEQRGMMAAMFAIASLPMFLMVTTNLRIALLGV